MYKAQATGKIAQHVTQCERECKCKVTHRRCDLVHQVAVDVEQNGAVEILIDNVGLEDLVVECLRRSLGGGHFGCGDDVWCGVVWCGDGYQSK